MLEQAILAVNPHLRGATGKDEPGPVISLLEPAYFSWRGNCFRKQDRRARCQWDPHPRGLSRRPFQNPGRSRDVFRPSGRRGLERPVEIQLAGAFGNLIREVTLNAMVENAGLHL